MVWVAHHKAGPAREYKVKVGWNDETFVNFFVHDIKHFCECKKFDVGKFFGQAAHIAQVVGIFNVTAHMETERARIMKCYPGAQLSPKALGRMLNEHGISCARRIRLFRATIVAQVVTPARAHATVATIKHWQERDGWNSTHLGVAYAHGNVQIVDVGQSLVAELFQEGETFCIACVAKLIIT